MIISPAAVLASTLLLLNTLDATILRPPNADSSTLCYTPAYASLRPRASDCHRIIRDMITHDADHDSRTVTFTRSTTLRNVFTVPKEWVYRTCAVRIDVPAPRPWEEASWGTVKRAATDVLLDCVIIADDQLGGVMLTGSWSGLQIEVDGRNPNPRLSLARERIE
ncbi:MAG: hypothetical protein LQ348_001758 [Seirophora lacunosa]|nr:MAG: hypothetical protein LQ348_001758 [Seirophora lacunosa]